MKVERHDPPPPPMPEAEYTITLTETEVKDLLKVIGCIAGVDGYPERNTTDALWNKLTKISRWTETPFQSLQLERKPPAAR